MAAWIAISPCWLSDTEPLIFFSGASLLNDTATGMNPSLMQVTPQAKMIQELKLMSNGQAITTR
jgi:hypothetical protein